MDGKSSTLWRRSRRDWILLPLLAALTVLVIALPAEFVARKLFRSTPTNSFDCLVLHDKVNGIHGIPNSNCLEKDFESDLVAYHFNSCGDRAGMDCSRPKSAGAFRIVLLGTSVAEGLETPYEETFAALLPRKLIRQTGRPIELYNEGIMSGTPHLYDFRFRYIMRAQPDLILWTLTKWDIEHVSLVEGDPELTNRAPGGGAHVRKSALGGFLASGFLDRAKGFAHGLLGQPPAEVWSRLVAEANKKSRAVFMLKHWLYASQSEYVKHYLMQGEAAEFLRTNPGPVWRHKMQQFDFYAGELLDKARAAGTPVIVTVLPERAEAAMISKGHWPAGYDPYRFGEEVRSVVERHGGTYIDVLHDFRRVPNPERCWYAMDLHPTAAGHKLLAGMLADGLSNGPLQQIDKPVYLRTSAGGGK